MSSGRERDMYNLSLLSWILVCDIMTATTAQCLGADHSIHLSLSLSLAHPAGAMQYMSYIRNNINIWLPAMCIEKLKVLSNNYSN